MIIGLKPSGFAICVVFAAVLSFVSLQVVHAADHEHQLAIGNCMQSDGLDANLDVGAKSPVCCTICLSIPAFNFLDSYKSPTLERILLADHLLVGLNLAPEPFPPKLSF